MTKPKAVARAPEDNQGRLGGHAHDQCQDGQKRREYPVHPDLLGMGSFLFADVAPVDVAQQNRTAGADVRRGRGVDGRDGAHEHDAQHEWGQELVHQRRHDRGVVDALEGFMTGQLEDLGAHALKRG